MKKPVLSLAAAAIIGLSAGAVQAACDIAVTDTQSGASTLSTSSKVIHDMARDSVLEKATTFVMADGLHVQNVDPAAGELVAVGATENNEHKISYYHVNVTETDTGVSEVVYSFKRAAETIAKPEDILAYFCKLDSAIGDRE